MQFWRSCCSAEFMKHYHSSSVTFYTVRTVVQTQMYLLTYLMLLDLACGTCCQLHCVRWTVVYTFSIWQKKHSFWLRLHMWWCLVNQTLCVNFLTFLREDCAMCLLHCFDDVNTEPRCLNVKSVGRRQRQVKKLRPEPRCDSVTASETQRCKMSLNLCFCSANCNAIRALEFMFKCFVWSCEPEVLAFVF